MIIEPWAEGTPQKGKVFAAVFPHSDDFTFFAGGLIAKLVKEGYTGYFIRMTDDCMDSYDLTYGETCHAIEKETYAVASLFGIKKVYDLNYKNHYMEYGRLTEFRHRLIMLFRFLKVDTVITFDPYGLYEENPEHYLTGKAVEQACWMAGRQLDLPESKDMGLMPRFVTEKYYTARGPQAANRIIDISPVLELKRQAIRMHKTPLDNMWKVYLEKHTDPNNRLADKDEFIRYYFTEEKLTECEGLTHYEKFHYVAASDF
jgi:LmbE family N-acetylglucosaminyl deacetylase